MSSNWPKDIHDMHVHYGFHEKVKALSAADKRRLLDFRFLFLREEMNELGDAIEKRDADGVVDALVDLCVVAIGTMDLYGVEPALAWERIHTANMSKRVGIKASRPNPLGLPDLIKPEGWQGPSHVDNLGDLQEVLKE